MKSFKCFHCISARRGAAEVPDCPARLVLQQRTWLSTGALHKSVQSESDVLHYLVRRYLLFIAIIHIFLVSIGPGKLF